jgi:hypothetical protein
MRGERERLNEDTKVSENAQSGNQLVLARKKKLSTGAPRVYARLNHWHFDVAATIWILGYPQFSLHLAWPRDLVASDWSVFIGHDNAMYLWRPHGPRLCQAH